MRETNFGIISIDPAFGCAHPLITDMTEAGLLHHKFGQVDGKSESLRDAACGIPYAIVVP